jgi:hypothetical protein
MAAEKNKKKPWKTVASSKYITNLKQSILATFDIYGAAFSKGNFAAATNSTN